MHREGTETLMLYIAGVIDRSYDKNYQVKTIFPFTTEDL